MMHQKTEGLIAAPFTPMDLNGAVNTSEIANYYKLLIQNNVRGAFICGSTGEGVSLTLNEKIAIIKEWSKAAAGNDDFIVMPLLGGTCLEDCKALARVAQNENCKAISFTSPNYFKPSSIQDLRDCCLEIASTVPDIKFYYYHIPVLNGLNVPMLELLKAVDDYIPSFAGIKYTHEDFMDYQSCIVHNQGRYDMLWGRDENMLAALSVGAKGAVGSTYNYAAPLYHDLIKAFENGDLEKARALQQLSIDMIRLLGKYGGIGTGKAFMRKLGFDCGNFRLPVKNLTTEQYERFCDDVDSLNFSTFSCKITGISKPVTA